MRALITVVVVGALIVLVERPGPVEDLMRRGGVPEPRPLLADARALDAVPGGPWPDARITYFNAAPEHRWALRQAIAAWNATSVPIRFEPAPRDEADVIITSAASEQCGHGKAIRGYSLDSKVVVFKPHRAEGCSRYGAARVIAHELGHVLGLKHTTATCAAMNPSGSMHGGAECPHGRPWQWRCRLLETVDIAAAARLYGGVAKPPPGPAFCPLYATPSPPEIRFVRSRSGAGRLEFAVRRPPDPALPWFVPKRARPTFSMTYGRGSCGGGVGDGPYKWTARPGQEQRVVEPILGSGIHCLRVWAYDRVGRRSTTAATFRVDVT